MKNIKLLAIMIMFIATFTACKKDKSSPEDPTLQKLATTDLVKNYVVAERKTGDRKLTIIFFKEESGIVKANVHRNDYLRAVPVKIDNMNAVVDVAGDGSAVYTFNFEKNSEEKLILKSSQFTDQSNPQQGITHAVLVDASTAQNYDNTSFKTGNLLFKLTANGNTKNLEWDIQNREVGTKYYPPPINKVLPVMADAPEFTKPFYNLDRFGWKAEGEFIGSWVPSWKGNNNSTMVVERNSTLYLCTKQ